MQNSCPLSFKPVDSYVARLSSLFVVFLVLLYLFTLNVYILFFLAIDFIIKLFVINRTAPLNTLSKIIKKIFKIKEKLVDGGAKRLAGFFGLLFVMLLLISHLFDTWILSISIAVIFIICSLLDVLFNYCIGCKIYFVIRKVYPTFMDEL